MDIEDFLSQSEDTKRHLINDMIENFDESFYKSLTYLEISQAGGIAKETTYENVRVIRCHNYGCFCILDKQDNLIVSLYKYDFIDCFDSGYARVNVEDKATRIKKWGIIDCKGNEVVPLEYDSIWNFYLKGREFVRMEKNNTTYWFNLHSGKVYDYNPWRVHHHRRSSRNSNTYGRHYGKFAGSYAQDVMGYSDDVINDAFEGDPDAYWNID